MLVFYERSDCTMSARRVLVTRRKHAHYGTLILVEGKPAIQVKSGKTFDYATVEEIVEDVYGVPVRIVEEKTK